MSVEPSPEVPKYTRPKGIPRPVTKKWKEDVLKRMGEMKPPMNKAKLAAAIKEAGGGGSTAAITQLFWEGPETTTRKIVKTSRLVDEIHKALGMLPPLDDRAITKDPQLVRLQRLWVDLADEERAVLVKTAELYVRSKRDT